MIATSSNVEKTMVLFHNFTVPEVLYILALVFQLTAGAMLLLGNMDITKKQVVSNYCMLHRVIRVYPNGDLKDYDEFIEIAKKNWMNRIAFLMLFLGYLISIFGETPQNKQYTLVVVMMATILMLIVVSIFTSTISKSYGRINFNEFILDNGTAAIGVPEDRKEMLNKK